MVVIDMDDCDEVEEEEKEEEEEEEAAAVVEVMVDPLCDLFLPVVATAAATAGSGAATGSPLFLRVSCCDCCWVVISLTNCRQFSKPAVRSVLH